MANPTAKRMPPSARCWPSGAAVILKEKFITLDPIGYLAMEFLDAKLIHREAIKGIQITEK